MENQPLIKNLEKAIEIKDDIRNSIISRGVEIPEETPFEEYPSKIDEIEGYTEEQIDLINHILGN